MTPHRLVAHFGSLRTTLVCMALLALAVLAGQVIAPLLGVLLTVALAALGVNLLAALVVHPAFRRQLPLLVAHLALLVLVVLVALSQLVSLDGRFELTQGVPFDGALLDARSGALHRSDLAPLALRHDGFEIAYAPGRKRGATRNTVHWRDGDGQPHSAVIGDHRPLVVEGFRIYTSPNKGFAPLLTWRPAHGRPTTGSVHLPSYPMHELKQSREWSLPDGREVWVQLQFDENLIDPAAPARFRLPGEHRLVVRTASQRAELAPGAAIELPGGTLVYEGLRSWMGYRVTRDPTLPWLLAAALLTAFGFAWHYVAAFRSAPQQAPRAALQGAGDA